MSHHASSGGRRAHRALVAGGLAVAFALAAAGATGCPRRSPEPKHRGAVLMTPEPFGVDEADPGVTPHPGKPALRPVKPPPDLAGSPPAGLIVHFFNVGQGDSILLKGPDKSLLVDCGEEVHGKTEHFRDVASGIATITGKNHVDYSVVSHYHYDHMGGPRLRNGFWGLLDLGIHIGSAIDRGNYFVGPPSVTAPGFAYLEDADGWVKEKLVGTRVTAHRGKDQILLGAGIEVDIVAVNANGLLETEAASKLLRCPASENDYSIALVVRYGAFEMFLGGDTGGYSVDRWFGPKCQSYHDVETGIAPSVGNVEILKANHHGSAHSSNPLFIDTLRPELTIATSGGSYHHPGRDFYERLSPWSPILVTGAVSADEWPGGTPSEMTVVGDVEIRVEVGGAGYWIDGKRYPTFDDAAEAKRLDHPGHPGM